MSITSFYFWCFLIAVGFIYYLTPSKIKWCVLLVASIFFFVMACGWNMLAYLFFGVLTAFIGAKLIDGSKHPKRRKFYLIVTLVLMIGELAALKYVRFFLNTAGIISGLFGNRLEFSFTGFLAPLGISYYTLSLVGYVLDVYWEKYPHQRNVFKQLLFACYFPQLTSGPITRYDEMEKQLFTPHAFCPKEIYFGIQRILWGLFKKLVIADRAAILVTAVFGDYMTYGGYYIVVAVLLFALQLYTDFSGCMDIIMGASQCLGVGLPENFNTPFFSETVAEFWRRWHITMGAWFKDYLLYPILISKRMQRIGKFCRKHFGKKTGKNIVTYLGLMVIWLAIGIWHGGEYKYIFASGILPGFFLITGEMFNPFFQRCSRLLRINTEATSWHIFRMFRTFLCLCASWIFVRASSFLDGIQVVKQMFSVSNPWVLVDGKLLELGLNWQDFNILFIGILAIWGAGMLHRHGKHVREMLAKQNAAAQWIVMLGALFVIIIYGIYGPQYDATGFIYKNF